MPPSEVSSARVAAEVVGGCDGVCVGLVSGRMRGRGEGTILEVDVLLLLCVCVLVDLGVVRLRLWLC